MYIVLKMTKERRSTLLKEILSEHGLISCVHKESSILPFVPDPTTLKRSLYLKMGT